MAPQFNSIEYSIFGGGNWNDQPPELVRRSHEAVRGGFVQRFPVESPAIENMDLFQQGVGKRLGSSALDDLTSVMVGSEELIDGELFNGIAVKVGLKSAYTKQSGAWAQLTNANGTAYVHNSDVTKVSFVPVDGHLIILTDGANNFPKVYRSGTALDDQFHNSTTTTTVDVTSNSGQKVLSVAATTMFNVGDRVMIDEGSVGGGEETNYVASISAGVSITLEENLANQHTSGQADIVKTQNRYTEVKDGTFNNLTGDWRAASYIGFPLHGRLCMTTGDNVLEFTDINQPWDLLGGGFHRARADIVAGTVVLPKDSIVQNQVAVIFTTKREVELLTGFDSTDVPQPIGSGGVPLSYRSLAVMDNWVVYLTNEPNIRAFDGGRVIDLGRRLRALDKVSGPLDTITVTNTSHATKTFGFADANKKQAQFHYPDASNTVNSHAVIVDFNLGEPLPGESEESFEKRVRCLWWSIKDPSTNPWFTGIYQTDGAVVGILAVGTTWTLENGKNDLDIIPILETFQLPHFDAGAPGNIKNWRKASGVFIPKGDWNVKLRKYENREDNPTGIEYDWLQVDGSAPLYDSAVYDTDTYASGGTVRNSDWIETVSREISFDLRNQGTSQDWIMTSFGLLYNVLNQQD